MLPVCGIFYRMDPMKKTDGRRFLPDLPPWEYATWAGAEYAMLKHCAAMTFRERLQRLENAAELSAQLSSASRKPLTEFKED